VSGGRGARELPELRQLEDLLGRLEVHAKVRTLATVGHPPLPIHGIVLGPRDRTAPTLAVVGGVHGLERIGTRVVLAWLHTLTELLAWDGVLQQALEHTRLVFVPLLNPSGMLHGRRGNGRGVDLMRNAPAHPDVRSSPLIGGQRLSPLLPWYMGDAHRMEPEADALCRFIEREVFTASQAISVDVHSGFGMVDRVWFPYARTRRPFPHLAEAYALKQLIDTTLPHHVYRMEPQAHTYTAQGDLWDHLHDRYIEANPDGFFLPLTLEMGSWLWVKKNPRQVLSALGTFNPIKPHRLRRTLRRHLTLFDLLHRAVAGAGAWARGDAQWRALMERAAFEHWYGV
jgi:hypothetical protein